MGHLAMTFILPTQDVAEHIEAQLKNEHLGFDQMLTCAASYVEHEDSGVAGSIYAADIENMIFDDIYGFDSEYPADSEIYSYNQYSKARQIAAELAERAVLVGGILKPIIDRYIDSEVYAKYTTDAAIFVCGDLVLRLKAVDAYV